MSTTTRLTPSTITLIAEGAIPCPRDMAAEIERDPHAWRGGELWTFDGGTALRGPLGDGAIMHGADSVWGTWAERPEGLVFTASDARDAYGDPVRYDACGEAA
jgi:hypothetical protein